MGRLSHDRRRPDLFVHFEPAKFATKRPSSLLRRVDLRSFTKVLPEHARFQSVSPTEPVDVLDASVNVALLRWTGQPSV